MITRIEKDRKPTCFYGICAGIRNLRVMRNTLFYGDQVNMLREQVADESVDLITLDPPFRSARNYNLLFKQVKGESSPAQIMAFEDTWQWPPLLYEQFRSDIRPPDVR